MSLLDDIKEELQRKKDELEEKRDEVTGLINFIEELRVRLSDVEKELLLSSIDSLVRKGKEQEAVDLQGQIDKNTLKLSEVNEQIIAIKNAIILLQDKTN